MTDPVNHPAHYTEHPSGIECIQITEHMGFNLGNAVKYIWRADLKGSAIEDLEKARWYINRELTKRDALFPATEPVEETAAEYVERIRRFQSTDPTPAESAEEETKAEEVCTGSGGHHLYPCVLPDGHAGVHVDRRGLRWNSPTSSPVVPAPAETAEGSDRLDNVRQCLVCGLEKDWRDMVIWRDADGAGHWVHPHCSPTAPTETGPWEEWESVPDDVWFTSASAVGFLPAHRKRGSLVDWQFRDGSVGVYDVSQTWNAKLMARAPFVAAEEKS